MESIANFNESASDISIAGRPATVFKIVALGRQFDLEKKLVIAREAISSRKAGFFWLSRHATPQSTSVEEDASSDWHKGGFLPVACIIVCIAQLQHKRQARTEIRAEILINVFLAIFLNLLTPNSGLCFFAHAFTQVCFFYSLVIEKIPASAFQYNGTGFQDVSVIGYIEGCHGVLLYKENGRAFLVDLAE